jgi:transposase
MLATRARTPSRTDTAAGDPGSGAPPPPPPSRSTRDFAALEARRLKAARLFASGQSQTAVARELGVTRAAAHGWYHTWKTQGGAAALKWSGRAGRKPRLNAEQLARVAAALRRAPAAYALGAGDWTSARVAQVIEQLTGVRYDPAHVRRMLRTSGGLLSRAPVTRSDPKISARKRRS